MQETINIIHYNINIIQIYIQLYHSSSFQVVPYIGTWIETGVESKEGKGSTSYLI